MKIILLFLNFCASFASPSPETRNKVTLRVRPNRSQFFEYEFVSLSCEQQENSPGWMILRNTSLIANDNFLNLVGNEDIAECSFGAIYQYESGVYWCESAAGKHSEAVNITVTDGSVILQSPALAVKEGDDVTLQCSTKIPTNDDSVPSFFLSFPEHHTADFYKDDVLINSSSTGNMTIQRVSKSDEGVYRCNISGVGQSPNSWLNVQEESTKTGPDVSAFPVTTIFVIIRHVVVGIPFLLTTVILALIYRDKRRTSRLVAEDERHYFVRKFEYR